MYQVLLTISKTLEIFCMGTYQFGLNWWSGMYSDGALWFQKSYFLEVVVIQGGAVLHVSFIMSSLFFSVVMAADRVFSL